MCQPLPTGLYTRWDLESETARFTPQQNNNRSYENMVTSFFQQLRPDYEIESFYTTSKHKKIDSSAFDEYCSHCNTVSEAMVCFYHFSPCQEVGPSLTEEFFHRGSKKRELHELKRSHMQKKGFTVIEMWECDWWRLYKTISNVKLQNR